MGYSGFRVLCLHRTVIVWELILKHTCNANHLHVDSKRPPLALVGMTDP